MSATLIINDPCRIFPTELEANKHAAFLEILDEDGWTYEVITSPKSGRSFIAVYDEDGNLMGNL
jgi:hypothetical protein